jgi:RimJ/RimL family protein N-acetyltransferase
LTSNLLLRDVLPTDLPVFFEQQRDPLANHMAAFTAKDPDDQAAFNAHWDKVMADQGITIQTILYNHRVAGYILCHSWFGDPEISYWIGREYWGQGIATWALKEFLNFLEERPLFARVVKDNLASLRVLQKCGFTIMGEDRDYANARDQQVEEYILKLEPSGQATPGN